MLVAAVLMAPGVAAGQTASPQIAPSPWALYQALGAPDKLKVSGTARLRLDAIDGQPRAGFNTSDLVWNVRTTVFAEYDAGPVRIGAELYDSRAYGADPGTPISANEVNVGELVQGYAAVDLVEPLGRGTRATVQAGRFVLNLGSRRLVAADDYRNTTNGYAGLRGDFITDAGLRATAIWVLPVRRLPDDGPALRANRYGRDHEGLDTRLSGLVVTRQKMIGDIAGEFTWLRFEERDTAERATRNRELLTMGGRLFELPSPGKVDFEVEAFRQTGSISATNQSLSPQMRVLAAFFHAEIGYTFERSMSPRVSLRYDWVSGDKPGPTFERFDTLYGMRRAELAPSGLYNTVGRANLSSPAVRIEWNPTPLTDAFVHYRPLWLASRTDSFSTSGLRDISGSSGSFAGHQLEGRLRHWLVRDALRLEVGALYLNKGEFLRSAPQAPRNGDTVYTSFNVTTFF